MPTNSNPFNDLRTMLISANKPAGIATRIAHCVLAAKSYRGAEYLVNALDSLEGGLMCTTYTDAFRSGPFRSNKDWHYAYDRLRCHAQSYLETQRHRAVAA